MFSLPTLRPTARHKTSLLNPDEEEGDMNSDLAGVKALYVERQYKSCISKCEHHLSNRRKGFQRIHEAYLKFYIGLSYDSLARNMSNNSSARSFTLAQAESYYLAAEASLAGPLFMGMTRNITFPMNFQQKYSAQPGPKRPAISRAGSISSIDSYKSSDNQSETSATSTDCSEPISSEPDATTPTVKSRFDRIDSVVSLPEDRGRSPRPLDGHMTSSIETSRSQAFARSTSAMSFRETAPAASRPRTNTNRSRDTDVCNPKHMYHFNKSLFDFRAMLAKHVNEVRQLRSQRVVSDPVVRPSSRAQHSSSPEGLKQSPSPIAKASPPVEPPTSPEEDAAPAPVQPLINGSDRRRRFEGRPRRNRFNPEKYQELCQQVLSEL